MTKSKSSPETPSRLRGQTPLPHYQLGPIKHRPIATLAAYEHNPRKHPEQQIGKLMASISEFGFAMPVLVDCEGVIISGQARVEAALRLGLSELPVLVADRWSKTQVRAYRLADNRLAELATWDLAVVAVELAAIAEFDVSPVELLGWDAGEIELMLAPDAVERLADPVDACPDLPVTAVSMPGDLWQLGPHRLLCGSSSASRNWPRLMDGAVAALVFSSWPHRCAQVGGTFGLADDQPRQRAKSPDETTPGGRGTMTAAIEAMAAQLGCGGVLMLAADWQYSREFLSAAENSRLLVLHACVRTKPAGEPGPLYHSAHELIWIARKDDGGELGELAWGNRHPRRTDVWDYPEVSGGHRNAAAKRADTNDVKSVSLVEDAIKDVTRPGEIVLDPFVGPGTTILAAERAGRTGYAMEADPRLVDVAIRRWEAFSGRPALHADSGESFAAVASCRANPNRNRVAEAAANTAKSA